MAADFARRCGRIDAVINNAALLKYEPLESISEETVDRMLGAGFKSAIWGSQALVRHMRPESRRRDRQPVLARDRARLSEHARVQRDQERGHCR